MCFWHLALFEFAVFNYPPFHILVDTMGWKWVSTVKWLLVKRGVLRQECFSFYFISLFLCFHWNSLLSAVPPSYHKQNFYTSTHHVFTNSLLCSVFIFMRHCWHGVLIFLVLLLLSTKFRRLLLTSMIEAGVPKSQVTNEWWQIARV